MDKIPMLLKAKAFDVEEAKRTQDMTKEDFHTLAIELRDKLTTLSCDSVVFASKLDSFLGVVPIEVNTYLRAIRAVFPLIELVIEDLSRKSEEET